MEKGNANILATVEGGRSYLELSVSSGHLEPTKYFVVRCTFHVYFFAVLCVRTRGWVDRGVGEGRRRKEVEGGRSYLELSVSSGHLELWYVVCTFVFVFVHVIRGGRVCV